MAKFYGVRKGKTPGIYKNWEDCRKQTEGFPCAEFKSFKTAAEAAAYMGWSDSENAISEPYAQDNDRRTEAGAITAYVDGSYNIATGEYGYGAVMITPEGETELWEKGTDSELAAMRNVAGEIKGAEAAMRYALENGYKKLIIYYDYEGIAKWCVGEWKTNKEGTKEYKRIYNEMVQHMEIRFVKVKGHSGDTYNDRADILAKRAAGVE